MFGVTGVVDALVPMDCAPSASAICLRAEESGPASWPFQAHTWFDVAGSAALLVSLWFLARGLRSSPRWRRSSETGRIGFAVLTALSVLLTVMSAWYLPGTGLVQRLVVLLTSVWLVVLSVDLLDSARRGAPEVRDAPAAGWPEPTARVIGGVVTLGALFSVLSVVARGSFRSAGEEAFGAVNLPVGPSLFSVALLVLLGGALRRRLRLALWVLVLCQALALVDGAVSVGLVASHGARALVSRFGETDRADLAVSAATAAALIPLLVMARTAFPARLYPASRRPAAVVLVSGLAVSAATALVLTWISPATLGGPGERIQWALRAVVGVDAARTDAHGHLHRGPHWVAAVAGVVSGLALMAAIAAFLRSARAKRFASAQDELGIRELLHGNGRRDSLGYFATRRDKSVVFGPGHRAAVTHRVLASVSLASGDPIGPVGEWPAAIAAWLAEAREYGWFPAVLGAGEEAARAYVAAGLRALPLGDEAVVDVGDFSLRSPDLRPVRRAVTRVRRAGYALRVVRHAELTAEELAVVAERAERWRGDEPDRGFSMALNRLGDPTDGRCVAVLATDPVGTLRGVLSFVPWGEDGLSLDLMRRDPAAVNGITEAMVVALLEQCPDLRVGRVSLNFAVLRTVLDAAERVGAGPLVRTGSAALLIASRFWQLQTLYRATARYRPRWVPRYVLFDSAFALPRVAVAAGMAEGFLPAPRTAPPAHLSEPVVWQGRDDVPLREAVAELEREPVAAPADHRRLAPEERARRAALTRLVEAGVDPYPATVPRTTTAAALRARFGALPPGSTPGDRVSLTGRVRAVRDFGGLVFLELHDDGERFQAVLTREATGAGPLALLQRTVHRGDYLGIEGTVVTSRSGELSVLTERWTMAAKCLQPVAELRAPLPNPEVLVRRRHLQWIADPTARELVRARGRAVRALRTVLQERAFDEVETPVLQTVHGGATARPFRTTINAYRQPLYLRIAPELYLKRMAVGDLPRIYELGRNFRNEGADATHNPEFTSLEAYQAWADYDDMRQLATDLVVTAAVAVHGEAIGYCRSADGRPVALDLSGPWPVVPVHEAVSKATGSVLTPDSSREDVLAVCREHGVRAPRPRVPVRPWSPSTRTWWSRRRSSRPSSPTSRPRPRRSRAAHRRDPRLAERWDLVAAGMELGTAYSELTDPVEQRRRLTEQSLRAAAGDPEAMQVDDDFLRALEYALPPTGGLGLGVDRLVMLLTGSTIRATLSFPFVRPEPSARETSG